MRIKRAKKCSKVISIYARCFGLNSDELEIFLDYTFVRQALLNQVNIYESLCNIVGRGAKIVTSSCVLSECQALGSLCFGALKILEQYPFLKCRHEYVPSKGAAWCIRRRIKTAQKHNQLVWVHKKKHERSFLFALASNDEDLRSLARSVPGMPVFFIAQRCVNTEDIPETTQAIIEQITSKSLMVNPFEAERLQAMEEKFGLKNEAAPMKKKKKKQRKSEPNPLSCRKKQASASTLKQQQPLNSVRRTKKRQRALRKTWAMRQVLQRMFAERQSVVTTNSV